MQNSISDIVVSAWQTGRKTHVSPSGWISGNAVCCDHRGHKPDKRGRGGLILDSRGGVTYSCFNCKFKTRYQLGGTVSYTFRKFLSYLGFSDSDIRAVVFSALKISQDQDLLDQLDIKIQVTELNFDPRPLPENSVSYQSMVNWMQLNPDAQIDNNLADQVNYLWKRRIDLTKYEFYWCYRPGFSRKIIIPFYWKNQCVGYQTRLIDPGRNRYYSDVDPGYVFNLERQNRHWAQVLVCEGVFDAMSIDACATLGSAITESQANQLDELNKPVIVVPDRDASGADMIKTALKYYWSVSFPIWYETCRDVNEALVKYGKLFTIKAILDGVESSRLRIEIMKRRWF